MSHYSPFGQTHTEWAKPIVLQSPCANQHLQPPFDTIIKFSLGMMGRRPLWSELVEVVTDMFDYQTLSYSLWKLFWGVDPHAPTPIKELWHVCNSIFVFWLSLSPPPPPSFWRTSGCLERMAPFSLAPYVTYSFIRLDNSLRSQALHIDLSAGEILSETL